MKRTIHFRGTALLSVALLFHACSSPLAPSATVESTAAAGSTPVPSGQAGPQATDSLIPTREATPTVWPPVFDLWSLEDLRSLNSFVVTVNEKNTVNGQLTERTFTIGYIREPFSAYRVIDHAGGANRTYVVNDREYELTATGDWYITTGSQRGLFSETDPAYYAGKLVDAQFAGEEEYEGISAYHFVLGSANTTESNPGYQLEGELYLAIEGNYILYSHWKETSKQGDFVQVFEVTQTLSSINQVTDFSLPAGMEEMASTANLPSELGLPLPPESAFDEMIKYENGIGVDYYFFTTPKKSIEEFLTYYRNLPPTNGWTVSHVGHVTLHQEDCEFTRECVIINQGSTQVILYYNGGTIRAEFDWAHNFSPLN